MKGKACAKRGSDELWRGVKKAIQKRGLEEFYELKKASCFGLCKQGPVMSVDKVIYGEIIEKSDYKKILKRHAKGSKPVKRLQIKKKK